MGFAAVCFGVRVNGHNLNFSAPLSRKLLVFFGLGAQGLQSVGKWRMCRRTGFLAFWNVSANWISGKLMCGMGCSKLATRTESANWISGEVSANWKTGFLAFCKVSANWLSGKLMCGIGCNELAICSQSENWISARLKQGKGYGIPRWNRKLTHKGN